MSGSGIYIPDLVLVAIRPALRILDGEGDEPRTYKGRIPYSSAAEQLLVATACIESACGHYLRQVGGPALGIFQMEPATHDSLVAHYLAYNKDMATRVKRAGGVRNLHYKHLTTHLGYAVAMARVFYYNKREALPAFDNQRAQVRYWKTHYNTPLGKGTPEGGMIKSAQAYESKLYGKVAWRA